MEIDVLKEKIDLLVKKTNFVLRKDLIKLLKEAYLKEKNNLSKKAIYWILENSKIARKENLAICQDTGFPVLFIDVGKNVSIDFDTIFNIKKFLIESYRKNYLRESIVLPFCNKKPTYDGFVCHIDFSNKFNGISLSLLSKGFGSENKSRIKMFPPTSKIEDIIDFVVNSVKEAGPGACPPFFIGIGIGGTQETAILLSKKALLEPLDRPNKDKFLGNLEKKILKKINSLKIGPMGFGGNFTALAVRIKTTKTHIAGLAVAVNISCHALRSATIKL